MQNSAKLQSTKQTNLDPLITTFSGSDAQHTNTCWDSTQSVDWWWKTNGFVSLWDLSAPTKTKKTWEAENESGEKRETFGPRLAANLTTSVSHYPSVHRFFTTFPSMTLFRPRWRTKNKQPTLVGTGGTKLDPYNLGSAPVLYPF